MLKQVGFVYVFKSVFQGESIVKIGYTCNLEQRMAAHRQTFQSIEVLRVIKADRYCDLEKAIHRNLSRYRLFGCWLSKECYFEKDLPKIYKCINDLVKDERFGVAGD